MDTISDLVRYLLRQLRHRMREARFIARKSPPSSALGARMHEWMDRFTQLTRAVQDGRVTPQDWDYLRDEASISLLIVDSMAREAVLAHARSVAQSFEDSSGKLLSLTRFRGTELPAARTAHETTTQYVGHYLRTLGAGIFPRDVCQTMSSLRTTTTACRVLTARSVLETIETLSDDVLERADMLTAAQQVRDALTLLKRLSNDVRFVDRSQLTKRPSKKSGLSAFGADAADRLFSAISIGNRTKLAVALLVVFGARPVEIEHGVEVSMTSDERGPLLRARIQGAKLTKTSGQVWRELTVRPRDASALHIVAAARDGGGRIRVARKRRTVEKAIERAGRRAFKRSRKRMSAYNLRNEIAAQLKLQGDPELVSYFLGHVSARSQAYYGNWRRTGGTGNEFVSAIAATELRHLERVRHRPSIESVSNALAPT